MLHHHKTNRRKYYILFAITFGFVWFLFKLGGNPDPVKAVFSTLIDIFFSLAALIITVELLLPRLFYKQRHTAFVLCMILLIAIVGSLTVISQVGLMGYSVAEFYKKNTIQYKQHFYYWFWSDLVLGSYFLVSFIALGGFAIRLAFDRVNTARQMEAIEKERSIAELEMLKNQINPHFLFNALNTIYYKIDRINAPARLMVERFSSLLRYQLYECNEAEVNIEKELKFVADYIELQKERLSKNVTVNYKALKNVKDARIAPFILMPLAENCFKHVSQYQDKENMISINSNLRNGWFCFETVNTIQPSSGNRSAGIGLENVKKRLDLVYQGKHSLTTGIKDGCFNLALKIKVQ